MGNFSDSRTFPNSRKFAEPYLQLYLYLKANSLKFIHKDVSPFSCKFCKEDFVEQYLESYLYLKANS
jgi:hypothetical protein